MLYQKVNQCNKLDVRRLKNMKISLTFCATVCCCLLTFQYLSYITYNPSLVVKYFKKLVLFINTQCLEKSTYYLSRKIQFKDIYRKTIEIPQYAHTD